jgi:hypothetical protein
MREILPGSGVRPSETTIRGEQRRWDPGLKLSEYQVLTWAAVGIPLRLIVSVIRVIPRSAHREALLRSIVRFTPVIAFIRDEISSAESADAFSQAGFMEFAFDQYAG